MGWVQCQRSVTSRRVVARASQALLELSVTSVPSVSGATRPVLRVVVTVTALTLRRVMSWEPVSVMPAGSASARCGLGYMNTRCVGINELKISVIG